ncbi:plastocyanin/azurin family copper-binding protein [Haladaptatus sp. ZSTT2]|uniref:plastocyanin/azurin family copper-binding protein n=1 Tax=Haladaptatus sp. ZSTT2 TaxID=3120515 RepID=UPI00300E8912
MHIDFPEGMEDTNPPFFHFEPTGLHVEPGDIVRFNFTTPDHTITALHNGHGRQQRVPEGVPPFSSPIINIGGFWLYQFDVEGLYDIVCAPHELFGMAMRIVVGDLAEGDVPAYEDDFVGDDPEMFRPPISKEEIEFFLNAFGQQECVWPFLTSTDVLSTDALDPDVIQTEGSVPFSDVAAELGYE